MQESDWPGLNHTAVPAAWEGRSSPPRWEVGGNGLQTGRPVEFQCSPDCPPTSLELVHQGVPLSGAGQPPASGLGGVSMMKLQGAGGLSRFPSCH